MTKPSVIPIDRATPLDLAILGILVNDRSLSLPAIANELASLGVQCTYAQLRASIDGLEAEVSIVCSKPSSNILPSIYFLASPGRNRLNKARRQQIAS